MRRFTPLLYILPLALVLSGCGLSLAADRHDIERLMLIQTMGIDRLDGRIQVSVSTGLGPEEDPALVMTASAWGIEDAIARLQNYSPENQLFYAHIQYLLLGEQAARQDLSKVIEWVDRSPTVRTDTALVIVRGTAKDAVTGASEQATDITQRLASLDRQARSVGWSVHTLREAAAAISEGGGALCLAVQTADMDDTIFTDDMRSDAIIPLGYAVLGPDGLAEILTPEASFGAELLTGDPTGLLITVDGSTMEVLEGSAEVTGAYGPDGAPTGVDVHCTLRAGVLEKSGDPTPEALDASLSRTVGQWVTGALEKAQSARCDFLGLQKAVLPTGDGWPDVFPTLPVTVTVDGVVDRSYDLPE